MHKSLGMIGIVPILNWNERAGGIGVVVVVVLAVFSLPGFVVGCVVVLLVSSWDVNVSGIGICDGNSKCVPSHKPFGVKLAICKIYFNSKHQVTKVP